MSGLTLKLAAGILAGIAVAFLVAMLDHALTSREKRFPLSESDRGIPGLRSLRDVLEAVPADSRPALVTVAQRSFDGLSLLSRAEAEAMAGDSPLVRPPTPGEPIFLPLDDGASWLVVAPPLRGPPQPPNPVIGLVLSLVALVVTAVGLTAWPLTRRIRKLQRGIRAIGEGRATEPLSERGRDVLADLARTVNGMAERVTRSLRDRDELLQAVSHEIGTPLARMRFQLELLEHASPERRSEYERAMQRELDELDQLATELVSWIDRTRADMRPAPSRPAPWSRRRSMRGEPRPTRVASGSGWSSHPTSPRRPSMPSRASSSVCSTTSSAMRGAMRAAKSSSRSRA